MSNTTDRLQTIEAELKSILEGRITELMTAMRESEGTTRKIIAAEMEIAQSRQLREGLDLEMERLQSDVTATRARVDDIRQTHGTLWSDRDNLREQLSTVELEVESAEREIKNSRSRLELLTEKRDNLSTENQALQVELTAIEEAVAQMEAIREKLQAQVKLQSSKI